ncbi:cytochrome P450 [Microdochium bolleyi]|uniref:Cytochrome P450 n=1 Tax=Microdochium bolleyi TaxID=196109 RepID=A0A136IZP3_9PEZI|nr:cytochrome P450 [Microdochium bolleyi]
MISAYESAAVLGLATATFVIARGIYLAFFHPLAKIPGPKLYTLTDWFYLYYLARGTWPHKLKQLHARYGATVRFSPDEVSTIDPEAWKQIYGHKKESSQQFPKDPAFYDASATPVRDIIHADNDGHKRMRRVMAHAFSEKALRAQSHLLDHHVDLFIAKFAEMAARDDPVDITLWYNFATFDVIGDLAFGQSFRCLEKGVYDPAVAAIQNSIKFGTVGQIVVRHPWVGPFFRRMVPRQIVHDFNYNVQRGEEIVKDRIDRGGGADRRDLLDYVLRHNDEKGLSKDEIATNATTLIIAGSDTTGTILVGTTFNLLTNRDKYDKLVEEIRGRFSSEEEINQGTVNDLPYLLAVFDESFRLYPPVPVGLSRVVPPGGSHISGYFLPENSKVSIPHLTAYRDPQTWTDPEHFVPERWLGTDLRYANDRRDILYPFSTGPRNCIGKNLAYAEMRTILTRLLWRFDLHIRPESRRWDDQCIYFAWEKGPLMVDVTPAKR